MGWRRTSSPGYRMVVAVGMALAAVRRWSGNVVQAGGPSRTRRSAIAALLLFCASQRFALSASPTALLVRMRAASAGPLLLVQRASGRAVQRGVGDDSFRQGAAVARCASAARPERVSAPASAETLGATRKRVCRHAFEPRRRQECIIHINPRGGRDLATWGGELRPRRLRLVRGPQPVRASARTGPRLIGACCVCQAGTVSRSSAVGPGMVSMPSIALVNSIASSSMTARGLNDGSAMTPCTRRRCMPKLPAS